MPVRISDDDGAQALDINELVYLIEGYGVDPETGGACEVKAASGMDITVADGEIVHGGTSVSISEQTVTIPAADADPRKDIIYLDSNGDAQVQPGTAEPAVPSDETKRDTYRPAPSDMSGTEAVVLAEVWVGANVSSIGSSDISDRRVYSDVAFFNAAISGLTHPPAVVTASDSPYTTQSDSRIAVDTTDGAVTVTLASADAVDGRTLKIVDKGQNAGSNPITIEVEGADGEVINPGGATSKQLTVSGGYLELENVAGDWYADLNAEKELVSADDIRSDTLGGKSGNPPDVKSDLDLETNAILNHSLQTVPSESDLVDGEPGFYEITDTDEVIYFDGDTSTN